MQTEKTPFFN